MRLLEDIYIQVDKVIHREIKKVKMVVVVVHFCASHVTCVKMAGALIAQSWLPF